MAEYRLYCEDGTGRIGLADFIEADSDEEAVAIAREKNRGGRNCEVWQDQRLVAHLGATDLAAE